jgi:hypothetical protein
MAWKEKVMSLSIDSLSGRTALDAFPQGLAPEPPPDPDPAVRIFIGSLLGSRKFSSPYRHWLLSSALPEDLAQAISELPWPPPAVPYTDSTREANNATRTYFGVENRTRHKICDRLAMTFQSREVTSAIERVCDIDLTGTSLRIEYCQDREGFWLSPHTDIGVKKFTMQIYLSKAPGSLDWGTDLLDERKELACRVPSDFNAGLIFIPGSNTWHGFAKRPIQGVRKSILVNYVGPEWRSRHELCFPDRPVSASEIR